MDSLAFANIQRMAERTLNKSDPAILLQKKRTVDVYGTRIFYENIQSKAEMIVNRGSARSSKSYSIAQVILSKFFKEKNKKFLIIRRSLPSLRLSVYQTMKEVLESFGMASFVREEKVGMNWFYRSNYLHFGSIDDIEKIKSTEWNYIWIEEATDFDYSEFLLLRTRLSAKVLPGDKNQMFLSFNPIDEYHWIKTKLLADKKEQNKFKQGKGGVQETVSTYKDNPFLTPEYIAILEGLIDKDFNFYRIYALGEWGRLEHQIYTNWDIVPFIPQTIEGAKVIYGLDFGYNDPMALERIVYKGLEVWEEQLIYGSGMTVKDLIREMDLLIPKEHKRVPIYCDSAEPDKIVEIKASGYNAKASHKSVLDGIDFVKRFKCHILGSSSELIRELRTYSWKVDKNERVIDEPIEFMDHLMSARRYALYTHLRHRMNAKVRWLP